MVKVDAEVHLETLRILSSSIHFGMLEALDTVGGHIVSLASQLAPRDSGDLSESGEHHLEGSILSVSFGNGLPDDRAIAQEYGTIYMPAQPYLSVAAKEISVVDEMARVIASKIGNK